MKGILKTAVLVISLMGTYAFGNSIVSGVDHVGLAVSKLNETEAFFVNELGFKVLRRDNNYPAAFLSNGEIIITLWRVSDPNKAVQFNRKENVGLHHLAFRVESFAKLQSIYNNMKKLKNIKIEFAPELLAGGPAKHMMLYEPSGNRIEFIHRPKPQ